MAMSIGTRVGSDFGVKDFIALGAQLGVPERAVRRTLTELAERAAGWVDNLDRLPFQAGAVRKLRRVVDHRRGRLTT